MFWGSVLAGLNVLTYWETYIAGLEYLAIYFIPLVVVGIAMEKSEDGAVVGCLSILLLPVLQIAAMTVMILTLAPIMLGLEEDVTWSAPWTLITFAPLLFLKLIGALILTALILAFIPVFGQLQSLQTLVLGGVALKFVLNLLGSAYPNMIMGVDFIPGFWFVVGLLVVGGIMSWIGAIVASTTIEYFTRRKCFFI